jgi:hypothetical protein
MKPNTCTNCGVKTKNLWTAGGCYKDCKICWNCLDDSEREQIILDKEREQYEKEKAGK